MTPLTVILTKVRIFFDSDFSRRHSDSSGRHSDSSGRHSDESQNLRFLTITQIPDQVRNDGTTIVILMLPPTIILTFFCHPDSFHRHPDESQDLRFLAIIQIPDQVRNDGTAIVILMPPAVILTKVRIFFDPESSSEPVLNLIQG